ncbi:MAG: hypothetical protein Tsb0013_04740 [Phycisphaerales bacterium]
MAMHKQILPVAMITVLTLVVWLFAEAESLTQVQTSARLRFADFGDPAELLATAEDFDENITITLRGSRGAIQRARTVLDNAIILRPGDSGVPDADGLHLVSLRQALQAYAPLAQTGVVIEGVRPQRVEVRVDELVEIELPIRPDLTGIVTQGDTSVNPQRARLRAPRRDAATLEGASIIARVDPGAVNDSTAGPRTESVTLRLPASIADAPNVTLLTDRATVAFTLRSTIRTDTFPSVPVQVLLTPQSARTWAVEIDERQQLIPVSLTGPGERLEQILSGNARLVAVLALSDIELSRGDTAKPVRLILLRDNVPAPLPEGVEPAEDLPSVRFTTTRLREEAQE